jgi:hypothetical protein
MKYSVEILFNDGLICQRKATKKPYVTDNRIHIENGVDEYTVIPMSGIKMYTVGVEQK